MKKCQSCNAIKPLDEFHKRTESKDGRQTRCKECNREQRKIYYKTAHGKKTNDCTGKRWRVKIRHLVYEYLLEHPCVDCGITNPVVLEFDHRDPAEKEFNIGACMGLYGYQRVMAEIAKCDVRCANCHRIRTAEQFGWYKGQGLLVN